MLRLRLDPVLGCLCAVTVMVLGWLALGVAGPRTEVLVCWSVMPAADLAIFALARRVYRLPATPPAPRRFWRAVAAAGLIFVAGDGFQLLVTVHHPGVRTLAPGVIQSVSAVGGAAVLVGVTLLYPSGIGSRRARVRFFLDAGTVMTAAAVIAWCLVTRPALAGAAPDSFLTAVVGSGVLLVGAFAAVKLGLGGSSPMGVPAALPMIAAAATQGVANIIIPTDVGPDRLPLHLALILAPTLLFAMGPRIQELHSRRHAAKPADTGRRRHSLLPYVATAITFGVFIGVLHTGLNLSSRGALAGVVLNVGLVIIRQMLALRENEDLLDRLDHSLHEARQLHEQLRHQATHDALTGLANRRLFADRMRQVRQASVAVLLIDLDDFKHINDTLGHYSGDQVLLRVAACLREAAGPADLVARFGGDEFAVLIPHGGAPAARQVTDQFLDLLTAPATIQGQPVTIRASVGSVAGDPADPEALLHAADLKMYEQKRHAGVRARRAG